MRRVPHDQESDSLAEEVERTVKINVVVRGLLLNLGSGLGGGGFLGGRSRRSGGGRGAGAQLGGSLFNKFVEFLSVEPGDQLGDLGGVGLGTGGLEDLLNVVSRGGGVSSQDEEGVRSDVFHIRFFY